MVENLTKCIAFLRVSTMGQQLDSQKQEVYQAIYRHGYVDNDILCIEQKESAIKLSAAERISIQQLYDAIKKYNIEYVFVYEISRLTRQSKMMYEIRDFLIEHKVNLYCLKPEFTLLDKNYKMSQTASILFSLFTSLSESEMMIKKERMKRGIEYKKAQGLYTGQPVPVGYKVENKRFVIDEEGAKIVRRIYEDYINGNSLFKLVDQLQKEGFRPKTNRDTLVQSVYGILKREYYCGDKIHPAIITKEIFEQARNVAKNKTKYWTKRPDEALFKGLIYNENGLMGSNRALKYYYRKREGGVTLSYKYAHTILWGLVKEWYSQIYIVKKNEFKDNILRQIEIQQKIVYQQEKNITENQDKIDRIAELYVEGKIGKDKADKLERKVFENLQNYKRTLDKANYELIRLNDTLNNDNIINIAEDMSTQDKIEVVRDMVEKIIVRRLDNKLVEIQISNRHTGEIRTIIGNTRKMTILNMKVILRPSLNWNGK